MRSSSLPLFLRGLLAVCALTFCTPLQTAVQAQIAGSPASPQPNRVLDQSLNSEAAPIRLPGHIPAWALRSADLGPVSDKKQVQLTVGLSRSPALQAAFTTFLADQQNPSSPHFHQWLTPQQIGALYGPTQHDLDAVTNWLNGQGLQVLYISPTHTAIRASASAAIVGHALQIQLHQFARGSSILQAPTAEPALPGSLTPVVAYVAGLADVPYYTDVHKQLLPAPASTPGSASGNSFNPSGSAHPNFTASNGSHYIFPDDFNTIYDITPLISAGINGNGQKIAILGGSQLAPTDLTTWESLSNLPAYQPNYIIPPGLTDPGLTSDGNQDEATLDFERSHGTAPGATIDLILDKNWLNFTNTDQMLRYEVDTLRDPILSLSFGVCEAAVSSSYISNEDAIYSQAAAQGIGVFISSGDSGAAGCENHGAAPPPTQQFVSINADCASSYVTCVGGTQFTDLANPTTYWGTSNGTGLGSALGYIPEGAFNEPDGQAAGSFQIFASGGGPSTVIPKPSWQKGVGVPADGFRDTPDVSFSSSAHDGYFSCLGYAGASCQQPQGGVLFSGTSAAAPSMAGIAALINQKDGLRQGNLNPLLYRTATNVPADFHDATPVTSGVSSCSLLVASTCNNSTPDASGISGNANGGAAGYALTTGYDLATGLGSLDVKNFVTTSALPASSTVLAATPSTITISQTVTLTATISGSGGNTPSGTVQFYSNGVPLSAPVTLSGGVATLAALIFKPAATYTITATYFGDANFAGSDASVLSLVVTNPNAVASSTTLTLSTASATSAQGVTFSAAVSGAKGVATGTVQFLVDGFAYGLPVALASGAATLPNVLLTTGTHSITAFYSGDDNYSASTSNAASITITSLTSQTSISLNPTTTTPSGVIIIGTTVTAGSAGPIPTGTVTLFQGTTNVGTLPLTNGIASLQVSGNGTPITPGTYPFDWVYSGDSVYAASTSATANLIVASAGISVAVGTPSLSVTAGTSASDVITLGSSGFAGAENLTCAIVYNGTGAVSSAPTCSVAPASVTLAANGTATATLTVATTAAHAIPGGSLSENHGIPFGSFGGMTLAALLLGLLPRRGRRKLQAIRLFPALIFLAASLTLLSGCGSGSTPASGGGTPATTAGSYTVTVTANSASNVGGTVTVALTVQ